MDNVKRIQISDELYGREKEIKTLKDSFFKVCNSEFQLVLVDGHSGIGKTLLINKVFYPLVAEKGFFITGKFDQFNRDEPYVPFVQAFQNLIRQILTEPKDVIARQKKELLNVLGKNGAILAGLIPEIELIIGKQPSIQELDPQKMHRRFEGVFRRFLKVFATEEHPVVIFIDDLHWADRASLQLLKSLCENLENSYFLIVGAYRDEEVDDIHPLRSTIKEIEDVGVQAEFISLKNLSLDQTVKLISDSLNDSEKRLVYLAEIVYRKTLGNPFFIKQMMQLFYDEKHLHFNQQKSCWEQNIDEIRNMEIPTDIVELVINRLKKLNDETIDVLLLAAGLGNSFDLDTLSTVYDNTPEQTMNVLSPSVLEGLVLPEQSLIELSLQKDTKNKTDVNSRFKFLHDRVQQAVCILITAEERKRLHLRIGRQLLKNTAADDFDKRILNIMVHFNKALDIITDPIERIKISEYNLIAGKKAKGSIAWHAARKYFKAGVNLLPENSWDNHYRLTYELNIELSQCEYLTNNSEEGDRLFERILEKAKGSLELAEIYYIKTILLFSSEKHHDAIKLALKGLGYLGIYLPEKPGKLYMLKEIILSKWYFRNKKIKNLLNMQENKSLKIKRAQELLTGLGGATNTINNELYALVTLKLANLSCKYGTAPYLVFSYVVYSYFVGSYLGNYKKGDEIEKAALKLIEKYSYDTSTYLTYFFSGALVSHWTYHGKKSLEHLKKAYSMSLEEGDFLVTSYTIIVTLEIKYTLGTSLSKIYQYCIEQEEIIKTMPLALKTIEISKEMIETLAGCRECRVSQAAFKKRLQESGNVEKMECYLFLVQLFYLYGDYEQALIASEESQKHLDSLRGYVSYAENIFYYSLSITAIFNQLSDKKQKEYRIILKKNQKKLKKWANYCPDNFLHKFLLVMAETSRINGRKREAMDLYDRAIDSALKNGYTQNEAIASELAGMFYGSLGRDKIASVYFNDAYRKYQIWGAEGKAHELKQRYKHMITVEDAKEEINSNNTRDMQRQLSDMMNSRDRILEVFKCLALETDIKKILEKFLQVVIETAGADKGYILMEKNEELYVEAGKEAYELPVKALSINMEECDGIPKKPVRYVARTNEPVILDDGQSMGIFSNDPYILNNNKISAVCLPLMVQDILTGVLYLEKNMTTERFTKESVEEIKIISCQMVLMKALLHFMEKETEEKQTEKAEQIIGQLTEREKEILKYLASGRSNREIAESLGLTINTVKTHVLSIYGKLGVNRRAQAAIWAKEQGL